MPSAGPLQTRIPSDADRFEQCEHYLDRAIEALGIIVTQSSLVHESEAMQLLKRRARHIQKELGLLHEELRIDMTNRLNG